MLILYDLMYLVRHRFINHAKPYNCIMLEQDRITIMLDKETHKKLRLIQANKIRKSNSSISLSSVINDVLKKGLR